MKLKIKRGKALIPLLFAVLVVLSCFLTAQSFADVYGSISVKDNVPVAPNPAPPNLPDTSIRFFLNTNPSPVANGLGTDNIDAAGTAADALYSIKTTGTITVLIDRGSDYGRTTQAKNKTSGVTENMNFPGGAPKAYELINNITTWYLPEAPLPPTFDAVLEGYRTGDFKPLIVVSDVSSTDPNHEKSTPYYKYEIYEGDNLLDSEDSNSTTWRPDTDKLEDVGQDRTYTVKVKTHNWFGDSKAAENNVNVPAPVAGAAGPTTETWTFVPGINTFAIPFVLDEPEAKPVTYKAIDGAQEPLYQNNNCTVNNLLNAIYQSAEIPSTVFGWFDAADQQHIGVMAIGSGDIVTGNNPDGDAYTFSTLKEVEIKTGQPYQVTVPEEVTFTLTGFMQ
ncbi:MAG: hypothetical protein KKA31_05715 [Candidatus Margulisbacteria bacterium]|nr:hypothetical protein [Candidatus Margulisiibacteriota bacterium]